MARPWIDATPEPAPCLTADARPVEVLPTRPDRRPDPTSPAFSSAVGPGGMRVIDRPGVYRLWRFDR